MPKTYPCYASQPKRSIFATNSRIVVDAEHFRKSKPSYSRLFTQKSGFSLDESLVFVSATEQVHAEWVESRGANPSDLSESDLLICAPTVFAFSLGDKF